MAQGLNVAGKIFMINDNFNITCYSCNVADFNASHVSMFFFVGFFNSPHPLPPASCQTPLSCILVRCADQLGTIRRRFADDMPCTKRATIGRGQTLSLNTRPQHLPLKTKSSCVTSASCIPVQLHCTVTSSFIACSVATGFKRDKKWNAFFSRRNRLQPNTVSSSSCILECILLNSVHARFLLERKHCSNNSRSC